MISEGILVALQTGDWRAALPRLRAGTAEDGRVQLGTLLANAMYCRAVGDLDRAWGYLATASGRAPDRVRGDDGGTAVWLFGLPPVGVTNPVARLLRVGWREQQDLIGLRRRIRAAEGRGARDVVIEAFCEHLTWVEHDPATWAEDGRRPAERYRGEVVVAPERKDVLERASAVRHFCDPFHGDVSRTVWDDAGRYQGLRRLAYERIARRWQRAVRTGEPQHVRPRLAYEEAERFARLVCPWVTEEDDIWRSPPEE